MLVSLVSTIMSRRSSSDIEHVVFDDMEKVNSFEAEGGMDEPQQEFCIQPTSSEHQLPHEQPAADLEDELLEIINILRQTMSNGPMLTSPRCDSRGLLFRLILINRS